MDSDLRVVLASQAFYSLFQVTPDETQGHFLYELGRGQWSVPKLRLLLEDIIPQKTSINDFGVDIGFDGIGHKTLLLNACQIYRGDESTNLILLSILDVTQRMQDEKAARWAEAILQRNSQLGSIGLLTTGITHELNNPLGIILGYCELALNESINQPVRHYLETIHDATERAARIVDGVLSFAGGSQLTKRVVDVKLLLDRVIEIMTRELAVNNIIVTREFAPEPLHTLADPIQLMQAIINIITNSQQAIRGVHGEGEILIHAWVNDRVRISIEDNGPGIPSEDIRRIFDPFFTSKAIEKGTGLGLSITHGIIRRNGGEVWADSVVGKGTTLHIELPISSDGVAGEEAPASQPNPFVGTAGRVLIVNDEPVFRELLAIALSAEGHSIDKAKNGEEAWDLIQSQDYDCVTINMWMPRMGGKLLYELIKGYNNELARRCIFITGAHHSKEVQEFIASTGNPSLGKPFHLDEIRRLVLGSSRHNDR